MLCWLTNRHRSVLTTHLRAHLGKGDPEFVFFDLVELNAQTAECVTESILHSLRLHFSEDFLKANWIAFISDGASVMLGKYTGVAARLRQYFPRLFIWHCLNHRLELAVSDAVDDVTAINHFKTFMDSIYCLYSMSPKNIRELASICTDLDMACLQIGKILSVRWAASSFRTVAAVWRSFPGLCAHFETASSDRNRDSRERSKYKGLLQRLRSPQFLCNLGIVYDVLQEMSLLSLELQKRGTTLFTSDNLVKRTVRVTQSMKELPGDKYKEALTAAGSEQFGDVKLVAYDKIKSINAAKFLQSLSDNLNKRLSGSIFDNASVLQDLKVLDKSTWSDSLDNITYGEEEIRRLSRRFALSETTSILGMRELIDSDVKLENLQPMLLAVNTIPCSTAECERAFSAMNLICTNLRSQLTVHNLSYLMFIKINGPPLQLFQPQKYIQSWLLHH